MKTLFKNANLLLPDGSVLPGCLGVEDNRIAFVGVQPSDFAPLREIDCGGNILMPGLINTHTHLPMSLFRGKADDLPLMTWLSDHIWPLEDKLTDDSVYWGQLLASAELLRAGVTCVNDMYMFPSAQAEALEHSGLRGYLARTVVSADDDGLSRLKEAVEFFDEWNGAADGRINISISPHAEYTCSTTTLSAIAKTADKLGARMHMHISETAVEHSECIERHGKTPTALIDELGLLTDRAMLAHCTHITSDDIARIAKRGAHVLHNPGSNLKLGSGIAPVPAMLQAGVNVALGTDGAASNNNLDILEEMRLAALIHKGAHLDPTLVTAAQAFAMATANGAQALGLNAGALKQGALADIVMIDAHSPHMLPPGNVLSNVVYSCGRLDVLMTMVDGQILYERGEYFSLDIERLHAEVLRVMETF